MKERHFFAGNNTAKGFFSYFDHIINLEDANHYYILKGGPGVGKSSFMKKFAANLSSMGHSVEYVHCSSDKDSLDAIVFPELKLAFVDGTAPHTVDPLYPGAIDEIINLGHFLDSGQLAEHKEEIIKINKAKSQSHKGAYRYLGSASLILEEINMVYDHLTNIQEFMQLSEETITSLFHKDKKDTKVKKPGNIRKLFSDSYTSDGYISFTDSLCSNYQVWGIIGKNINFTSSLLDHIVLEATKMGLDTEGFYRPLNPDKLQHVIIPELNIMIRSDESKQSGNYDKIIDLQALMDVDKTIAQSSELEIKQQLYNSSINQALKQLANAKKLHGNLERLYVGSMDFNGVDECFDTMIKRYK